MDNFFAQTVFTRLKQKISFYNVCDNHDYCYVEMPKEDNKILKYNHGEKSIKIPFITYADLEGLLVKIILKSHQKLK